MTNTASKTSIWENGLIWFGAALSIAEIQTGTFFAPLGLEKGLMAILLGHLIGCGLLFGAGVIGGRTGKSAMETVKMSFGRQGGRLFALLVQPDWVKVRWRAAVLRNAKLYCRAWAG